MGQTNDSDSETGIPHIKDEVAVGSGVTFLERVKFFATYLFVPLYMLVVMIGATISKEERDLDTFMNGTCHDLQTYDPIPRGWLVALSLVPFILVMVGILGLNWSSHTVAPLTLIVTIGIGLGFFGGLGWMFEYDFVSVCGIVTISLIERTMWTVLDYAFNVFAAFVFLEVVERWGIVRSMQDEFEILANDGGRKILLVAFCFAIVIAVVAPGGSNFLIAGSILIKMNIGKKETEEEKLEIGMRIAAICLFGNGLTSAFNLVGVCIIAIAEDTMPLIDAYGLSSPCAPGDIKCATRQIGFHFSLQFLFFCVVSPLIMIYLYTASFKDKELVNNVFLAIGCGVVYGGVQLLTALYLGPELPCLTSAGAAFLFYVAYLKCTETGMKEEREPESFLKRHSYAIPFILLLSLLSMVRLIPHLEFYLEGGDNSLARKILNPMILDIVVSCGAWQRSFPWLSHSGMVVVFCAVVSPFTTPYRSQEDDQDESFRTKYFRVVKISFQESFKASAPIVVSIASYASLAKVMSGFYMTQIIAESLVSVFQGVPIMFGVIAPFIGMIGAGLTGSTTTSNFLFGRLQVQTAIDLGISGLNGVSPYAVAAINVLGSSAGEIISPMNAVFSTVLLKSTCPESEIIKRVIPVFFFWFVSCVIVSILALSI